jgi:O-glycosyl hydrolase
MHHAFSGEIDKKLRNLEKNDYVSVDASKKLNAVTATSNYTATNYDYINASKGSTITLPRNPVKDCFVVVRNSDGSKISIIGNGRTVNSKATATTRNKGTSLDIYYFIDTDEWFIK